MSVTSSGAPGAPISYDDAEVGVDFAEERGDGWVAFAGVLLLILGTLNVTQGIAAVADSSFFVHNTHYVIGSLNTWGWVVMCVGFVEWIVGLGVFVRSQLSRWTGVVVLSINAIAQLLMMPAYPWWSLTIFTLDVLAIYGLIAYGRRISSQS